MKYYIKTFGCQMNVSDSERIASLLENIGYKSSNSVMDADFIIINTCSVRQSAEDRVYGLLKNISRIKQIKPDLITIVTGCIASKDPQKLKSKVDIILDIRNLFTLPQKIREFKKTKKDIDIKGDLYETYDYLKVSPYYGSKFHAYIPIMTGCNNFCSYCVVPFARGREYSRFCKDILEEVKSLVDKGYKAVTLLGQNVNSYKGVCPGEDEVNFPRLLQKVNDIKGNFWIWFVTSHPKDMSDELIQTIKNCNKVCNYIHLPFQAGNDDILKSMNRMYTRKDYLQLVEKIRSSLEDSSISTDAIVGYPGESEEQFEDSASLMKKIKFDMAYIAQYSSRPGTAAAELPDNVSKEEKKRRDKELTKILQQTALENNKKLLHQNLGVLVEKYKNGFLTGKTRTFKTVKFEGDKSLVGKFANVKITSAKDWGLEGKLKI